MILLSQIIPPGDTAHWRQSGIVCGNVSKPFSLVSAIHPSGGAPPLRYRRIPKLYTRENTVPLSSLLAVHLTLASPARSAPINKEDDLNKIFLQAAELAKMSNSWAQFSIQPEVSSLLCQKRMNSDVLLIETKQCNYCYGSGQGSGPFQYTKCFQSCAFYPSLSTMTSWNPMQARLPCLGCLPCWTIKVQRVLWLTCWLTENRPVMEKAWLGSRVADSACVTPRWQSQLCDWLHDSTLSPPNSLPTSLWQAYRCNTT